MTGAGTGVNENNPYYAARAGFQNQLNQRNMNQNYQNYGGAAYGGNSQGFGQGNRQGVQGMPNQNGQMGQQNLGQMVQQVPVGMSAAQNGGPLGNFPQYGNAIGGQQSIAGQQNAFSQVPQNIPTSNQLQDLGPSNQAVVQPSAPQK